MNVYFRNGIIALLSFLALLETSPVYAQTPAAGKYTGKKILYINSYAKGYEWSDGIERGIRSVIEPSGAELRVEYMDTKNHPEEAFRQKAGADAKAVADAWKPDLIIASDDNAVRYVIVPYFKNTGMPVVFNGVNWDAEQYGLPCSNVTGMLEVDSLDQLLKMLRGLRPDRTRVAVLAADTESERQEVKNQRKVYGIDYVAEVYASTFGDWKKDFLELQDKADILQLQNRAGIKDWNDEEARAFVLANTKIFTGSINASYMSQFAMVDYAKIPEEQGEWAAKAALEIFDGKPVSQIPLARNVKGKIYLNAPLVRKLGVTIPGDILNVSEITK